MHYFAYGKQLIQRDPVYTFLIYWFNYLLDKLADPFSLIFPFIIQRVHLSEMNRFLAIILRKNYDIYFACTCIYLIFCFSSFFIVSSKYFISWSIHYLFLNQISCWFNLYSVTDMTELSVIFIHINTHIYIKKASMSVLAHVHFYFVQTAYW